MQTLGSKLELLTYLLKVSEEKGIPISIENNCELAGFIKVLGKKVPLEMREQIEQVIEKWEQEKKPTV